MSPWGELILLLSATVIVLGGIGALVRSYFSPVSDEQRKVAQEHLAKIMPVRDEEAEKTALQEYAHMTAGTLL
jgi:hypothetical protein